MSGGIRFLDAKGSLRLVCDNGVSVLDPRVMRRTNEATQEILSEIIPVNGMMTVDVAVNGNGYFILPDEVLAAIETEVLGETPVNGQSDVRQGWYDIVNPFTYVDESMAHDNPLIDHGLVQDANKPEVLHRAYTYPGLSNATVRITGPKAYKAITSDDDFLIVQNVPALKLMIQAIERRENNDPDGSMKYKGLCIDMLAKEVKKFLLDPRNTMRRKANYESDVLTFKRGSMAWMRARLALEVRGAMSLGKSELTRVMERAEMRLMELVELHKYALEEFDAKIIGGNILFPARVESVLAANACGQPLAIRSIFFKYLENGPGEFDCSCGGMLLDQGEHYFAESNTRYRKFRYNGSISAASQIKAVCKLRWVPKEPDEQMTIQNLEAMRLGCDGILLQQAEKWNEGMAALMSAKQTLLDELKGYLSGIKHTVPISTDGIGMGDIGSDCN